jgi:hypothetical protein
MAFVAVSNFFGSVMFSILLVYAVRDLEAKPCRDRSRLRARERRMNASRRFVVWGTIPLGSLLGGALASAIGLRESLFVGAIGASVAFVPLLYSPIRSVERIPEEFPEPA